MENYINDSIITSKQQIQNKLKNTIWKQYNNESYCCDKMFLQSGKMSYGEKWEVKDNGNIEFDQHYLYLNSDNTLQGIHSTGCRLKYIYKGSIFMSDDNQSYKQKQNKILLKIWRQYNNGKFVGKKIFYKSKKTNIGQFWTFNQTGNLMFGDCSINSISQDYLSGMSNGNIKVQFKKEKFDNKDFFNEDPSKNIIPKIIHACWMSGEELPQLQKKCLQSWKKLCPDYQIKIWTSENWNVNKNTFSKQAFQNKQWAFVSDVVRLDVLYEYGGIYLDFDVEIKKSFDTLLFNQFFTGKQLFSQHGTSTPYILGSVKKDWLIKKFLDYYKNKKFIKTDGTFQRAPNTCLIHKDMVQCGATLQDIFDEFKPGHRKYPSYILGYQSQFSFAIHHFQSKWLIQKNKKEVIKNNKFDNILKLLKNVNKNISTERYGPNKDGGYIIPFGINFNKIISIGVGDNISFQKDYQEKSGNVQISFYDPTVNNLPENIPNSKFNKIGLGNRIGYKNLQEIIQQNSIKENDKVLLKIDCQGGQWDCDFQKADLSKIHSIILEIHNLEIQKNWSNYENVLQKIYNQFQCINLNSNNNGKFVEIQKNKLFNIIELTFINKSYKISNSHVKRGSNYNNRKIQLAEIKEQPEIGLQYIFETYGPFNLNQVKDNCRYEWTYKGFNISDEKLDNLHFVKTDYLNTWYKYYKNTFKNNQKIILITGFSDMPVTKKYGYIIDDENIEKWYACNLDFYHPKIKPIPIGICGSLHRNNGIHLFDPNTKKTKLINCRFGRHCGRSRMQKIIKINPQKVSRKQYFKQLSESYFCISPDGCGIDCHRTWQALYLKSIPIIIKNKMSEQGMYNGLPVIILDKWEDFKIEEYTKEKYEKLMKNFDPLQKINMDNFIK